MCVAYAALILSKHFVKIVKALGDNLCEATKLVTTKALKDMKLGSCNLQREPFSPLEARRPADPPNKPQQFAKPLLFTGGCHQKEEGENCKPIKAPWRNNNISFLTREAAVTEQGETIIGFYLLALATECSLADGCTRVRYSRQNFLIIPGYKAHRAVAIPGHG
ncbi:hypothetical protein EK904_010554 [Melospiza melodia maxima]|nr:hypothetical protein EK904_010554 [Melospiza melodia maxima]